MGLKYEEFDWYATPLYYDIVFEEDTELEGRFLESMLTLYGPRRGHRILEPACGTGRLVAEMARRGYSVTGFDMSDASLGFAAERLRAQGLRARLGTQRMESFRYSSRFDLVHCFVSTFKYLLTEKDSKSHLEAVARVLQPGGVYVLGFHLSDYEDTSVSRERWTGERNGTRVVCNIQSWPPDRRTRREKVRSRLVVERNGTTRRFQTTWPFRTYDAAQFRRLLRSVPDLELVANYDFTYDLRYQREFNDDQLDNVVILRKKRPAPAGRGSRLRER